MKIKQITGKVTGIKSLSLICAEQQYSNSHKSKYHIISSVLFEYTPNGAYIHYFANSKMKSSEFIKNFTLRPAKKIFS